jgi:hypothetical protein
MRSKATRGENCIVNRFDSRKVHIGLSKLISKRSSQPSGTGEASCHHKCKSTVAQESTEKDERKHEATESGQVLRERLWGASVLCCRTDLRRRVHTLRSMRRLWRAGESLRETAIAAKVHHLIPKINRVHLFRPSRQ